MKLSRIYNAYGGETWDVVARRATGSDTNAADIQRANPGVSVPLHAGALIQIPSEDIAPVAHNQSGLSLAVDGVNIGMFDDFELAVAVDAIAKLSFSVPNVEETRKVFVPLKSGLVSVAWSSKTLFTGRYVTPVNKDGTLLVSSYSLPGVLENGTPQIANMPCEWKNASLEKIATDLCGTHGINVIFEADEVAVFDRVDIQPAQPILDFLGDLASQRGLIIGDDENGNLVFRDGRAVGTPVSFIDKRPGMDVQITIDESQYFSSVTGIVPARSKRGKKGASKTVLNPHRTAMIREHTFEAKDIAPGELETAVNSAAGRMFAQLISGSATVPTWVNDLGDLYWPGQTVWLQAADEYIYTNTEFMISMVSFIRAKDQELASLSLCLPGVYNGEMPEELPWL